MKLKSILAAALCAVGLAAFAKAPSGSEENPWKIGSPNIDDVQAWTNGTGTLVIEGTGDTWPDFTGQAEWHTFSTKLITAVEIRDGVTSLGAWAVPYFSDIASVTIPSSVTNIGEKAFEGCTSLPSLTLSEGLQSIGEGAFEGCEALASVTIPASVTSIGEQAFAGCTNLTSLTLSEGLQSIGLMAFRYCALENVTIPASVTSIGGAAFHSQGLEAELLKSVTLLSTVPPALGDAVFGYHAADFVIHVPEGTAATYKAAPGWSSYADNIDDGTGLQVASIFPNGDGGKFVPAAKGTVTYNGAVIAADGVAGTVELKMNKPNRNGEINFTAKVVTADNQKFSFKAKETSADDAPLTVTLEGSNKKSKAHALTVTLEGNSLKGTFDGATIDGASDAFKDTKSERAAAILPFVGTWTGAFYGGSAAFFSAKISAKGKATVKVTLSDGKSMSCSAKAEVGDGVIVVPVTVQKSAKGTVGTFGFRLAFGMIDGKAVCGADDIAPIKMADKKTGEVIMSDVVKLYAADELAVTSKEFKTFQVTVFGRADAPTKTSLKMASTGLISGSIKWGKETGKASGVVIGGKGVGLLTVTQKAGDQVYEFSAEAAK